MFEVGDVVVCVDVAPNANSSLPKHARALRRLQKGRTYRVASIGANGGINDYECIALDGVHTTDIEPRWQNQWAAHRFRKVKPASAKFTAQMRALKPAPQHANHPTEGAI